MENKTCRQCNSNFTVTDEDLAFINKISPEFSGKKYLIPSPTLCPDCRLRRRLAWRNVRYIYRRKSDLSGQDLISIFAPNNPFKTYHTKEINDPSFDPIVYGRNFDFSQNFFDQFRKLQLEVPRAHASVVIETMENSEFANLALYLKNAYMSFGAVRDEDVCFCDSVWDSKKCLDCYYCNFCENGYQLVDCNNVYQGYFDLNCTNCREISLCIDLISCQNCFGCAGLRNKQYCFFNQQLSKDEYQKRIDEYKWDRNNIENGLEKVWEIYRKIPHKCTNNVNTENSLGDFLTDCKNCTRSFDLSRAENCHYCNTLVGGSHDNMDVAFCADTIELGYEGIVTSMNAYLVRFSSLCFPSDRDLMYCDSCSNCSNLFGCVGLKKKQYCILNKQYTKEEYEQLVPKIIEHMRQTGEWGEFFPLSVSPYGYNETTAHEWYPLTKEEALKLGANWQDEDFGLKYDGPFYTPKEISLYDPKKNPDAQKEIDELLKGIIQCEITSKPFRIISQELAFYIEHGLPIPTKHPNQRYKERFAQRRPRKLYDRQCMCEEPNHSHQTRCPNQFTTTYSPDRPEKVYCEECYQKSVL